MNPSRTSRDEDILNSLRWRLLGPFRGGRVVAVAGDPDRALVFYSGSTGGGVWKTEDAGWTWQNVSDGYFRTASVGALAVAEADPNVIYAGMGECCIRNNVAHGDGVYRSTDGGRTGNPQGSRTRGRSPGSASIRATRILSTSRRLVTLSGAPGARRVRSTDGGKSWKRILFRNDRACACDLSMDPNNPRILFAAIWEAQRSPWDLVSGGPGSGLFKTTNGGESWTEITENPGLPGGTKGRIGVVVSPALPERVWAIVEAEEGGIFGPGQRRRHLDLREHRARAAAAAVLLLPHLRGPCGRRHRLRRESRPVEVGGRRARFQKRALPHGDTTTCGSTRGIPSA